MKKQTLNDFSKITEPVLDPNSSDSQFSPLSTISEDSKGKSGLNIENEEQL